MADLPPVVVAPGTGVCISDTEGASNPKRRRKALNSQDSVLGDSSTNGNVGAGANLDGQLGDISTGDCLVAATRDIPDCSESDLPQSSHPSSQTSPSPADSQSSSDESSLLESSPSNSSDDDDAANESKWAPAAGAMGWLQEQMQAGADPRDILKEMLPSQSSFIPTSVPDLALWKLIASILCDGPKRTKLTDVNTLDDVIHLLQQCSKIIVLTGAGVSVSCGIPDFRSRNGLYARIATDYPDLPDPQAIFDIGYFRRNPRPFFKFAKEIYPGKFAPSPSHRFIKLLEGHGKLLHNYSQNIDTLERAAGIQNVVECHGSFATASCTTCGHKVNCDDIKDDIDNQIVPRCKACPADPGVVKPDIVFFGENLPEHFHEHMAEDKDQCDLLIVMGSSLKVRPVSLIPSALPGNVPQILINKERLPYQRFDVELLGDCDTIVRELCCRLGYDSWPVDAGSAEAHRSRLPMHQVLYKDLNAEPKLAAPSGSSPGDDCMPVSNFLSSESQSEVVTGTEEATKISKSDQQPLVIGSQTCSRCCGTDGQVVNGPSMHESTSATAHASSSTENVPGCTRAFTCKCSLSTPAGSSRSGEATASATRSSDSLAEKLPDHSFLFIPPSKHIFAGAEFCMDDIDDPSSSEAGDSIADESSSSANEDDTMQSVNEIAGLEHQAYPSEPEGSGL